MCFKKIEIGMQTRQQNHLMNKFSAYCKSTMHVQAARYLFYNRKMETGQSYAEWIATLRGFAKGSQFVCESDTCSHMSFADEQI